MNSHPLTPQHEPPESPSLYCTPAHSRAATPSPLARVFKPIKSSKQAILQMTPTHTHAQDTPPQTPNFPYQNYPNTRDRLLLRNHHKTDPAIWCCAIICLIFSIVVILFGITTLIIFLVVKPRNPVFDTNHASLNVVYIDSPGNYNGDFTFIANFSNPNRKLNVKFEYALLELFFDNNMIANQTIRPFIQREKEMGTVRIHFISRVVYMPLSHVMELKKQVLSNKVMYSVRGTFRVRVSFGMIHFTYWLHGRCELQMSSPPTSVLMARRCITKR
ncbi:Late embryogenesis abundant protein, LEA-14 [Artemisia annua]|uniref:Late embryogenesis abundant protein, LEA-14 n=1 Tax=Artemisia annua TaxID=35608 RepID=A0A2U1PES3_ARTAN|nr:Late embryogenesis abundant protein, LEA-14 [Artemisia annua]